MQEIVQLRSNPHPSSIHVPQAHTLLLPNGSTSVCAWGTVASNHLQGPHRKSLKAMSKSSDTLIDSHLGQSRDSVVKKNHIKSTAHCQLISRVCLEKYIFNHFTLIFYTFRGFKSRISHLIMSISDNLFGGHRPDAQIWPHIQLRKNTKLK